MRVTSALMPAASSAVNRVFRLSSRWSASSSTVPEALLSAALSGMLSGVLSALGSAAKVSCSPGSAETGSPPYRVDRPAGWAESFSRIFRPLERVSQPEEVCMAQAGRASVTRTTTVPG